MIKSETDFLEAVEKVVMKDNIIKIKKGNTLKYVIKQKPSFKIDRFVLIEEVNRTLRKIFI